MLIAHRFFFAYGSYGFLTRASSQAKIAVTGKEDSGRQAGDATSIPGLERLFSLKSQGLEL